MGLHKEKLCQYVLAVINGHLFQCNYEAKTQCPACFKLICDNCQRFCCGKKPTITVAPKVLPATHTCRNCKKDIYYRPNEGWFHIDLFVFCSTTHQTKAQP